METVTPEQAAIVNQLVTRIAAHQKALKLSNAGYSRRFTSGVGSERTWSALKDGKWQGHSNPDRIIPKLKAHIDRIEGAAAFDKESFIADLPFVKKMDQELGRLLSAPRDRRCMIALVPEGVGKSWWASSKMAEMDSGREVMGRYYVRLNSTMREKPMHIARAWALKLGAPLKKNPAAQLEEVIAMLKTLGEVLIIVDEGHLGGVAVFRQIKDLIDETSARFIYLAFPTEFDLVRTSSEGAMAEARQLFRRSIRPIFDDYRYGIGTSDVMGFLKSRGMKSGAPLEQFALKYAPILAMNQNLSTLADAFEEAEVRADMDSKEITLEMVGRQIIALTSTAKDRLQAAKPQTQTNLTE